LHTAVPSTRSAYSTTLFDEPLDSLRIRVALAPVELGPYNKHAGYAQCGCGLILANRHHCDFSPEGEIIVKDPARILDFIVHELTHHRQDVLLKRHGWTQNRGSHRDRGWYTAIAEAAPRYLGVKFAEDIWPRRQSVRVNGTVRKQNDPLRLTEVEVTDWPDSFRKYCVNS
jgi:hypothetical protein